MDKVDNNILDKTDNKTVTRIPDTLLNKSLEQVKSESLRAVQKYNIKLILICVTLLIIMTILRFGIIRTSLIGSIWLVFTGILMIILNNIIKNDEYRAIAALLAGGICGNIYSVIVEGSSTAFIVNYIILAMTALYFNKKIMKWTMIPLMSFCGVLAIVTPYAIEGPGGQTVGAIAKVIMLITTYISLKQGIRICERYNEVSYKHVIEYREETDKYKDIANELNSTVVDSNEQVSSIVSQTTNIDNASKEINSDMDDIYNRILSVNNSVSVVRNFMEKDRKMAVEVNEKYQDVVNIVNKGMDKIETTKVTMNNMDSAIETAYDAINVLVDKMSDIDETLKEIDEIFSQTKLLALNASIEAARAGEKGKGFSVVAEEIRTLSEASNKSANNIRMIIEQLNETVDDVSYKMKDSSKIAKQGYNEVNKMTSILDRINETSEIVGEVIEQEGKLINDINNEFKEIAEEITGLFGISDKNIHLLYSIQGNMEEQNDSIHNLSEKMKDVKSLAEEITAI